MRGNQGPKILIWDIESTNLNATFGTVLCIGYKWVGRAKVSVPTILEHSENGMLDDKGLIETFAKVYNEADYTVAHYGSRFDLPMIQSKCIKYGMPPLAPKPMIDTWRVARYTFKLHSNRLATLAEFLDCPHSKTPIIFDDWLRAAHGDKKALKSVVHHCKMDVLVLEEVFLKCRPFIKDEPSRRLFLDLPEHTCPSCGSEHLHHRGIQVARSRRYQRYHCQDCGKWSRSRKGEGRAEVMAY